MKKLNFLEKLITRAEIIGLHIKRGILAYKSNIDSGDIGMPVYPDHLAITGSLNMINGQLYSSYKKLGNRKKAAKHLLISRSYKRCEKFLLKAHSEVGFDSY